MAQVSVPLCAARRRPHAEHRSVLVRDHNLENLASFMCCVRVCVCVCVENSHMMSRYYFLETFTHYRNFFLVALQMHTFSYVIPCSLRLRAQPVLLFWVCHTLCVCVSLET